MEQTFADRLRERAEEKGSVFGCALWMFVETAAVLLRENRMRNAGIGRIALVTAALLLLPLAAMQFTDEVAWGLADFAIAGVLLFGAGLTYELVARRGGTAAYRTASAVAVGTALILVWISLAVGIIGSEDSPANLMYAGVLAAGIIGAVIARFQPQGMARAMVAAALAQLLVGVVAQIVGLGAPWILNGLFAALWIGSALLFRRAARPQPV